MKLFYPALDIGLLESSCFFMLLPFNEVIIYSKAMRSLKQWLRY